MEKKEFPLRVILTVTTGRLLTNGNGEHDNGIGDLYDLLGWMTNDQPFTHQLPRFAKECKPWLLDWFPGLEAVNDLIPAFDEIVRGIHDKTFNGTIELFIEDFLAKCITDMGCRPSYHVLQIPPDDHEHKHPYDELVAMRGTDEGIIVVRPE